MTPKKKINNLVFYPVPEFLDVDIAFGARQDAYFKRSNLPDVPDKFDDMASKLFFNGGTLPAFAKGVDVTKATRAIKAWLSSFAPAHEEKITTVAYALWLWTDKKAMKQGYDK